MIDCPACPLKNIAADTCPQCGADLRPLLTLEQTRRSAGDLRAAETARQSAQLAELTRLRMRTRVGPVIAFVLGVGLFGAFSAWRRTPPVEATAPAPAPVVRPEAPVPPRAAPPPPAPAAAVPEIVRTYKVRAGDTFWSIARDRYGNPALWQEVWNANRDRFSRAEQLAIGDEIRLPRVQIGPR